MTRINEEARVEAVRLYQAGHSRRTVAGILDCSAEMVRVIVRQAGIRTRPSGPSLPDLQREILNDIRDQFDGIVSLADLHDWLGGDRTEIEHAVNALVVRGALTSVGDEYRLPETGGMVGQNLQARRRNARILELRATGATYDAIAAEMKVSRNTVAGVCHRGRHLG